MHVIKQIFSRLRPVPSKPVVKIINNSWAKDNRKESLINYYLYAVMHISPNLHIFSQIISRRNHFCGNAFQSMGVQTWPLDTCLIKFVVVARHRLVFVCPDTEPKLVLYKVKILRLAKILGESSTNSLRLGWYLKKMALGKAWAIMIWKYVWP